jgi:hypothetical protein
VSPTPTAGGRPISRPAPRVTADVRDMKITLECARREHDVFIDPRMLAVDEGATRKLRGGRPGGAP